MPKSALADYSSPGSRDEVFERAKRALERINMRIEAMDEGGGRILATSSRSWRSWGEVMTVAIGGARDGRVQIHVESAPQGSGGSFDLGKNRANIQRFLTAMDALAPQTARGEPSSSKSYESTHRMIPEIHVTDNAQADGGLSGVAGAASAVSKLELSSTVFADAHTNEPRELDADLPSLVAIDDAPPHAALAGTEATQSSSADAAALEEAAATLVLSKTSARPEAAATDRSLRHGPIIDQERFHSQMHRLLDQPGDLEPEQGVELTKREPLRFDCPIYSRPDFRSAQLHRGVKGEVVVVAAVEGALATVKTPLGIGYVLSDAIGVPSGMLPTEPSREEQKVARQNDSSFPANARVVSESFLLDAPQLGGGIIRRAFAGESFRVTGFVGSFACVNVGRRRAFVRADALGFNVPPPARLRGASSVRRYTSLSGAPSRLVPAPRHGGGASLAGFGIAAVIVFCIAFGTGLSARAAAPRLADPDCWQLKDGDVGIWLGCAGDRDIGGWCAGLADMSDSTLSPKAAACAMPALLLQEASTGGLAAIALGLALFGGLVGLWTSGHRRRRA